MRLLLDTHLLLWALVEPTRLNSAVRATIEDPDNEILFSAASIWEIAIKASRGRTDFRVAPDLVAHAALESGLVELPVRSEAAARVVDLPPHHRDPFDRLLIAQALTERVSLYTVDAVLARYSDLVVLL